MRGGCQRESKGGHYPTDRLAAGGYAEWHDLGCGIAVCSWFPLVADLLTAASPESSARLETRDSNCPKGGYGPSPAWPLSTLTNDMRAVLAAAIVRLGWVGVNWAATGPGESREEVVYRAASNSPAAIP